MTRGRADKRIQDDRLPLAPELLELDFSHAYPRLSGTASFKVEAEDFKVTETLAREDFSGSGEHLCLRVRKRDQNTRWVAAELARFAGVEPGQVGYAGLKDRRSISEQWFSLPVAGNAGVESWAVEGCEILDSVRHTRKLRPGNHRGNYFEIRLRDWRGGYDRDALSVRLDSIARLGVPNYFGEQRFGKGGANLSEADRLLQSRRIRGGGRRGIYLSAARSLLFNRVLSARVTAGSWNRPMVEETLPDGPLWGRGRSSADSQVGEFEAEVLAPYAPWLHGLEHCGLNQERRGLVLRVRDLEFTWSGDDLRLCFALPVGSYATSVLRELVQVSSP